MRSDLMSDIATARFTVRHLPARTAEPGPWTATVMQGPYRPYLVVRSCDPTQPAAALALPGGHRAWSMQFSRQQPHLLLGTERGGPTPLTCVWDMRRLPRPILQQRGVTAHFDPLDGDVVVHPTPGAQIE